MSVVVTPITESDVESFRECLDAVARERRYLSLIEAPPLEQVRAFVCEGIAKKVPQVVAKDAARVVGWCDILQGWQHARRHSGALGMGLLAVYRGQGLGRKLLAACLERARESGITRVELEARADNENAIRLYERMCFAHEGRKRRAMKVDGKYFDTVAMALLLDGEA